MKELKLAIVNWEDAGNFPNICLSQLKKEKPLMVQTYGCVFKDEKYHYIMTHNAGDVNDDCCDWMKVPNSLVRQVYYVKRKPVKARRVVKRIKKNRNRVR